MIPDFRNITPNIHKSGNIKNDIIYLHAEKTIDIDNEGCNREYSVFRSRF
ncbi:hypothetical protein KL86DYS1_31263 [uncultured Dysgonomonas sp.]|uniref:Uncharacterized protein n=1 Tax=uncultured Dysgonomonas sp. TaxID=206096 RepID=A0A212K2Z4_9BACT|nr:hypothetical protein KL86DYS1_31263 [uncultured Dysgonomonas sp.]